jgi:hypothetical protein
MDNQFANENFTELFLRQCGRSDRMALRLNKMERSTAPLWTNNL